MKAKLILLFAIVFCSASTAQKWTNYYATDGLVNNYINAIALDAQGNIWVGTAGGVSKFNYLNSSSKSTSAKKDSLPNTMWTTYLAGNDVFAIDIDALGNIWFGTHGNGIKKFDGTNWTDYNSEFVYDIAIDAQDNKWFAFNGVGVSKFDGTNWTHYSKTDGLGDNWVSAIGFDSQNNTWFGTGSGISQFDGLNWTTDAVGFGLAKKQVHAITIDTEDHIWFGTHGNGVLEFYEGSHWRLYNSFDGLTNDYVNSIAIDAQGNKWVATGGLTGGGLSKINGDNFTNYHHTLDCNNCLADEYVTSVAIDANGNKWFGTHHGLSKFEEVPTGVPEPTTKNQNGIKLSIYPNPSINETTVLFPCPDKYSLIITDMNGRIVKQIEEIYGEKVRITTDDMDSGIYLVSLKNLNNDNTYKGRVVVTK